MVKLSPWLHKQWPVVISKTHAKKMQKQKKSCVIMHVQNNTVTNIKLINGINPSDG